MADSFSDFSHQGYFSRIGSAIVGVLFGLVLFAIAIGLLGWNEGRAVHRARALSEGAAEVVSVDAAAPESSDDGKLIHFSGMVGGEPLTDPIFGVTQTAVRLQRVVEMYQWKESQQDVTDKDAVGGGTNTHKTYTYTKAWSPQLLDSRQFRHADGHSNPTAMRVPWQTWTATNPTVGKILLSPGLVEEIDNFSPVPIAPENIAHLPSEMAHDARLVDASCYMVGAPGEMIAPDSPAIGDLKISLRAAPPGEVSVIARQSGNTVGDFVTPSGLPLKAMLYLGDHPAAEMFKSEQASNTRLTWILRGAGFLAMLIATLLILMPLKVMADVIGFIGSIVGAGVGLVAFCVAAVGSLLTIAIAWIAFRPIIGILLIVAAITAAVPLVKAMMGKRKLTLKAAEF